MGATVDVIGNSTDISETKKKRKNLSQREFKSSYTVPQRFQSYMAVSKLRALECQSK